MESSELRLLNFLRSFRAADLYSLAPGDIVRRGASIAHSRRVVEVKWADPSTLSVKLHDGGHLYVVDFSLNEKGALQQSCVCPKHAQMGACSHTVAGIMALILTVQGPKFGSHLPDQDARKFKTSLEAGYAPPQAPVAAAPKPPPPPPAESKIFKRVIVGPGEAFRSHPKFKYGPPGTAIPKFEFAIGNRNAIPEELRGFCAMHLGFELAAKEFLQWLRRPSQYDVEIAVPGVAPRPELAIRKPLEATAGLRLSRQGSEIGISTYLICEGKALAEEFIVLGPHLIFLMDSRRICSVEGSEVWRILEPQDHSVTHLRPDRTISISEFNNGLIRLDPKRTDFFPPLSDASLKPELRPRITIGDRHGNEVPLHAELAANGAPIGLVADTLWNDFAAFHQHGLGARIKSGARLSLAHRLAGRWLLAGRKDKAEMAAVIKVSDLKATAHQVLNWLKAVDAQNRRKAPPLVVAAPEGWGCSWILVGPEGNRLASLLGAIPRALLGAIPAAIKQFAKTEPVAMHADAATFDKQLPRLAHDCAAHGIELISGGAPLRVGDLLVAIHIQTDDLDWFELAAAVRCAGQLIPQSQWEAILQSGQYKDADGAIHLVSEKSLALLAQLIDLAGPSSGGARSKKSDGEESKLRLPRLAMLAWADLKRLGAECQIPPEFESVLDSLSRLDTLPQAALPGGLKASLRDYQRHGYDWLHFLYEHRFGAVLADDMGLGKTIQVIALLAKRRESRKKARGPHLAVLPPTLIFNWRQEIEKFAPGITVREYIGAHRNLKDARPGDVVLTTYDIARRDVNSLSQVPFDIIIFDEAQAVKNLSAERSKSLRLLDGRFKVCLTGTPLENHVGEYFAILDLALPGIFGEYADFSKRIRESSRAAEAMLARARPFVLRRTKERILHELPAKIQTDLVLDLDEEQKRYYTRAVGEVREEVLNAYDDMPASKAGILALTALLRLRQICVSPALVDGEYATPSPKIVALASKLVELRDEGLAGLVFSQFVKALDLVAANLEDAGIPYVRMDGATPTPKRKGLVEKFQASDGPPVFLISLKTGGAGLNLTRASHVFHLDPWWNPAVENQATDRAHRIGQKQLVFVHRLLMRHSVEEKMMTLKERKRAVFERILAGTLSSTAGTALTREDFQFLLGGSE
jgi:superfamily II DNA or RNA helicase